MNKRPKITVTEANREYVIPTLQSLGGINKHNLTVSTLDNKLVYYLEDNDSIIGDYEGFIDDEPYSFYEVDPTDYVGVKDKVKTNNPPTKIYISEHSAINLLPSNGLSVGLEPLYSDDISYVLESEHNQVSDNLKVVVAFLQKEKDTLRECLNEIVRCTRKSNVNGRNRINDNKLGKFHLAIDRAEQLLKTDHE